MKALKEHLKLWLYGSGHFGIAYKLNIPPLVVFVYLNFLPIGNELFRLDLTKVIKLISEIQLHILFNRGVVQNPLQRIEILVILFFHIQISNGYLENMFVKCRSEISIQHVPIKQRLTHYPADELEIVQVLAVHIGHWWRLVGVTSGRGFE